MTTIMENNKNYDQQAVQSIVYSLGLTNSSGIYTKRSWLTEKSNSYEMIHEDRFIYIPKDSIISSSDDNDCIFIKDSIIESAIDFCKKNGIKKYVGG